MQLKPEEMMATNTGQEQDGDVSAAANNHVHGDGDGGSDKPSNGELGKVIATTETYLNLPAPGMANGGMTKEELAGTFEISETGLRFRALEVNGHEVWVLEESCLRKDIDHCLTCGCYGLHQEFFKSHYCVESCYMSSPQWLEDQQQLNAPIKLFKQPALPADPNPFKEGQMLEGIDPDNQSLFTVLSISEVVGWRLKLHFEGYSSQFDFWVNCDSLDIFPVGWCEENGFFLQPPGPDDPDRKDFKWDVYLAKKKKHAAPKDCFWISKEENFPDGDVQQIFGLKLEAVDIRANHLIICVATVGRVIGHRFLVHFDSWDNIYDYWADLSSPFVFPVGYCERNKISLTPPNAYKDFTWESYLAQTGTTALPSSLFTPLPPVGFKRGMRIECVDQRNKRLIRPAVIQSAEGHMIMIRYEGWSDTFDVKVNELSDDLHPVGYCETTGHPLELVPKYTKTVCPNLCGGKGNGVYFSEDTHSLKHECPYLVERQRVERVYILVPTGSSGISPVPPHVLPGPNFPAGLNGLQNPQAIQGPASPSSMTSMFPAAYLSQSMTIESDDSTSSNSNFKLPHRAMRKAASKREDILAKMMRLASSILQEEREGPSYLFEETVGDLTPETLRNWDVDQTHEFVNCLPNCQGLAVTLKDQLIDGDSLLLMNKEDFVEMSPAIHWMKLYYALELIKSRKNELSPELQQSQSPPLLEGNCTNGVTIKTEPPEENIKVKIEAEDMVLEQDELNEAETPEMFQRHMQWE